MSRKHDINEINLEITNVEFWSPHERNKGGMRIHWSSDIGFGTLDIVKTKGYDEYYEIAANNDDLKVIHEDSHSDELNIICYTETMDSNEDKEFTRKLLSLLADKLYIVD